MPNVSTFLSGGVSVGILASVVSGLVYLVVAGIRWAGKLRASLKEEEGAKHSHKDEDEGCSTTVCSSCSKHREVKLQSGEWFYKQVHRRFYPAAIEHNKNHCNNGVGMEPECVQVREFIERLVETLVSGGLDDVCVKRLHSHPAYERMFTCHHAPLCEALARLSFTLQMAIANKPMPEQESPSSAHSALKQLVQNIIHEAMTLPTLQGLNQNVDPENETSSEDMTSKTYEDILATAILNKVIQQYQKSGALDGNKNILASSMEQQPTFISRIEIGVKSHESCEDEKLKNGSLTFDSSLTNSDIDPMSLTIEECIEEVTTISNEEEEVGIDAVGDGELGFCLPGLDFVQRHRVPFPELGMDIVEGSPLIDLSDHEGDAVEEEAERSSPLPTDLINPVESWEENWLFQRRRLKNGGAPQPMPVPMLVPNPSEDYRALIGDRDAEEISDLSDCSDGALEDLVMAEEEHEPDPQPVEVSESEVIRDEEQISAIKIKVQESEPVEPVNDFESLSEERNELLEAKNVQLCKSSSVDCLSEFGQQDSEYTEDYTAATRRQLDSLSGASDQEVASIPALETSDIITPLKSSPQGDIPSESSIPAELEQKSQDVEQVQVQINSELAVPPRPGTDQSDDEYCTLPCTGTIAEREHKKWETAPPLPNNPYSPENISKRLNKRNHYSNRSSSSEASVEFPEFKSEPVGIAVIEKPLQIVCAPGDLDSKRYGRDYYINSKSSAGDKSTTAITPTKTHPSNLQSSQPQENSKLNHEVTSTNSERNHALKEKPAKEDHENKIQVSSLVENEVARLQKEINRNEQWYKNIVAKNDPYKNVAESNKPNNNSDSPKDLHKFTKVIINDVADEREEENHTVKKSKDFSKRQQIPHDDLKQETIYGKSSFKQIKFPAYQEQRKSPEIHNEARNGDIKHIDKKHSLDEQYIEACLNGSGRSESPSESSVISTDSEFGNLPSVKELTKRFSSMADSDSSTSTSTPKCPSPAPRWKTPEQPPLPAERTVLTTGRPSMLNSLSPNRPVREVHSLTARSISREFREGLRRNQPLQLDRNIYNQSGSCTSLTASSNGESSSIPSSVSDDRETPSPIPPIMPRSVSSNIAFWEQLQQDKS
ncbi:uncharacterized protein [Anabrus simplex]|uniref:uncharacterized protein isoform X3 n=1 Tax=Anabrus simplex TaxID=316456 RepID=UPI0035A27762